MITKYLFFYYQLKKRTHVQFPSNPMLFYFNLFCFYTPHAAEEKLIYLLIKNQKSKVYIIKNKVLT